MPAITRRLLPLLLIIFIAACAPSEAAIQAAIQATADAAPTNTPTSTPTDTPTPRPTDTPRPTNTPVPTETPDPITSFVGIWVSSQATLDLQGDGKAKIILPSGDISNFQWKISGEEFCFYTEFRSDTCRTFALQGGRFQLGEVVYQRQDEPPPTSVVTDIDAQFYNDAVRVSELYFAAMEGLAAQASAIGANTNLLFDSRWKMETAGYLIMITTAGEYVRDMIPSDRFRAIHADMVEASVYYDLAAKLFSEGIDEIDATKIRLSTENLNNGTTALDRATTKLNAMK